MEFFHCENDQKLKDSHPTSHYGLWFSNGFHFTHVALRLHCQGNRLLRSEYILKCGSNDLSARVKDR